MEIETAVFYAIMVLFTVANPILLLVLRRKTKALATHTDNNLANETYHYQETMFYLSIPFIFECGYRSVLPRVDIPRLCFWDVWGNNVLFGRLSAFIGEWCWMLQISLALQTICEGLAQSLPAHKGLSVTSKFAFSLPFVCLLAEILGTAGPVTKNNLWCIWEAVTWTYMFAVASSAALYMFRLIDANEGLKAVNKDARTFCMCLFIIGLGYCPYMLALNIPMYVKRYYEDEDDPNISYLSFAEGLPDISYCHSDDRSWSEWSADAAWMIPYFGPAVWTAIWMTKAPRIETSADAKPLKLSTGENDMEMND